MTSAGFHQLDPGWADCLALLTLLPWPLLIVLGKETDTSQANQTSLSSDLEIGLRGTELPGAELPLRLDTWSKDLRIPRRLPELHWFLLFLTLSCSSLPMTLLSCSRVLLQVLAFTSFFCLSQTESASILYTQHSQPIYALTLFNNFEALDVEETLPS